MRRRRNCTDNADPPLTPQNYSKFTGRHSPRVELAVDHETGRGIDVPALFGVERPLHDPVLQLRVGKRAVECGRGPCRRRAASGHSASGTLPAPNTQRSWLANSVSMNALVALRRQSSAPPSQPAARPCRWGSRRTPSEACRVRSTSLLSSGSEFAGERGAMRAGEREALDRRLTAPAGCPCCARPGWHPRAPRTSGRPKLPIVGSCADIAMFAPKSSREASGQASLQVGPAVRNAPRFAFYTFGSSLRNAS